MEFDKKDLLSYDEIENLLTSDSPNDRSTIICDKLKKYVFIQDEKLYKYDTEMVVYKLIKNNIPNMLITITTSFLSKSKGNLNKEQSKLLSLERKTEFKKLCENATINKMLPQLMTTLIDDTLRFEGDFYEIHYKNGYIDLKTLKFEKRIPNKHFVTNYISRNYKPSTPQQQSEFLRRIKKIYPIQEDLNAILFIIGSALTGKATLEQKILFLLGNGSNGKSAILKILEKAVEGYMETLEEDAFSMTNKNPDKTFSNFHNRPHIRIIWNNEPKADQMNVTSFKKFVEGEMKGKLLYENGTHNFNHNALPVFTANLLPNIKIDGGVKRRFRGYFHVSTFTTNKLEVDESKNIYLVDRDLVNNTMKDDLIDAFVDILACYANKWINGEELPFPKSFQQATDEMMEVNDHIQDFIDAKLKFTESNKDRIGKNDMLKLFSELYPKKNISLQQLISLLKAKNVKWHSDYRCSITSIKGCFVNVVEKLDNDIDNITNDEAQPNPLDYGVEIKPEETKCNTEEYNKILSINDNLIAENIKLHKQIEKLKKLTQKIKLADGNIYNYDSDDDKEDYKLKVDEINLICNNECEEENTDTDKPKKVVYRTKKSVVK